MTTRIVFVLTWVCGLLNGSAFAAETMPELAVLNEAPSIQGSQVYIKPIEAILSLPLKISLSQIEKRAQTYIPETIQTIDERRNGPCVNLYVSTKCLMMDLKGWVKTNGALQVTHQGNQLVFKLPLKAQIKAKGVGKYAQQIDRTGQGALTVTFLANVGITKQWKVQVDVTSDYHWDEPFYTEVYGFKLPLGRYADEAVSAELIKVAEKLETQLVEQVNLKSFAEQLWLQLQQAQFIGQKFWLKGVPQQAFIRFIGIRDNRFDVDAGIKVKVLTSLTQPENKPSKPLADLKMTDGGRGALLKIPLFIDYEQIAEQLAWRINDEFVVEQITMYPHRNQLVLAIEINDDELQGIVHVVGKPVIDEKAKQVKLTALRYSRALSKTSAKSPLHPFWRKENQQQREQLLTFIEQSAVYDYDNMLKLYRASLNEQFANVVAGILNVQSRVDDITLSKLVATEQGLVVVTLFKGDVAATWNGKDK